MWISVVIPAYNEEKYIQKTLRSLGRQSHRDFEVVLAITGSDHTKKIARQVLEEEKLSYQFVFPGRKGVALARQEGTIAARHKIIASTDADAVLPPQWLKTIADAFRVYPNAKALYGPVYLLDGSWLCRQASRYIYPLGLRLSRLFKNDNASGNNLAFRADEFKQVGGYDTRLRSGEDINLIQKIKATGLIEYSSKLYVYVSARRLKNGLLKLLIHAARNYFRIFISHRPPRNFEDVR